MGKIIVISLLLIGCAAKPITVLKSDIVTVQKPVITECPVPPVLKHPELPISKINKSTPYGEVGKAYKASIRILQGHIDVLEEYLNGYSRNK